MEAFFKDVQYSVRMFWKSPGFTITAITALALGIGSVTAIFSVVDTVLLKPLPVFDSTRFVQLLTTNSTDTEANGNNDASPAKFQFWRAQSSALQYVSAFHFRVMNYTGSEFVEQLRSIEASADTFRCWGIFPIQGRTFTQEEDLPHGPLVALISENLWTRRFASDPHIIGKPISLNSEPYTVIGILAEPPGLRELSPPADVYVPIQIDPNTDNQGDFFPVVARLKPGISLEQAKAQLRASASRFRTKFPNGLAPKESFTVAPFREALVSEERPLLLVLLGAVSLVLLIACANVANLLLVRATGRQREFAIRAALGAARTRVIRQLLIESLLLSLAGGALGLLLGFGGIRALLAVNAADLPLVGTNGLSVQLDWRVMCFALGASVFTGILFGLLPAFQASRVDLNALLKSTAGRSGTGLHHNKTRAVLVVGEVGLAVILLVGSALLIRSFAALYSVNPGFQTKNVVTMKMSMTGPKYATSLATANAIRNGLERLRALPGVVEATSACCVPLDGDYTLGFEITGRPGAIASDVEASWTTVSPGFFETFQIPVKRGRTITERDTGASSPVAVINESMAKQFWKGRDPLQDRILIGKGLTKEFNKEPSRQIVGIVGDVRNVGLKDTPRPIMYVPQAQLPDAINTLFARTEPTAWIVRTQTDPNGSIPAILQQLRQANGLPVTDIHSMAEVVSLSTGRQRFNMLLMTVFGCTALLLAAIGVYGLMAYTVEQRTQEIGIRLALGAGAIDVRNMVVRQGMGLVIAGVLVGLCGAWALSRLLESLLFGVSARDPTMFGAVAAVLSAVALAAVWLPAYRASRVNPADSLRYE